MKKNPPHWIVDSEGVSIFHKERKNQETNGFIRRYGTILLKFLFVTVVGYQMTLKFWIQVNIIINFKMGKENLKSSKDGLIVT